MLYYDTQTERILSLQDVLLLIWSKNDVLWNKLHDKNTKKTTTEN